MSVLTTIDNIISTNLRNADLRYCLVNDKKCPFKYNGTPARSNIKEDFVDLTTMLNEIELVNLNDFAGIGISIQASEICAIDVDHCFQNPFDINSADERAKDIINRFKDIAYIEFSFSGKGLRILFKYNVIEDYSNKYYIKNQSNGVEYYQPNNSFRYVTVTGRFIYNNEIKEFKETKEVLYKFLDDYMTKPFKLESNVKTVEEETRSYEELMKLVRIHYFKNMNFQNLWFNPAPGSGSDESERDYHLVAYLYENITQDKDLLKQIFESSKFFKTKDRKHVYKWEYNNYRYFNYIYDNIRRRI